MRIFFAYLGDENGLSDRDEILHRVGVPDVITRANFGGDRFRESGGGVAGVEFPTFPLTYAVVHGARVLIVVHCNVVTLVNLNCTLVFPGSLLT